MVLAQTTVTTSSDLGAFFAGFFFVYLLLLIAMGIAWVQILRKAGYSGAWVLVGLVPFVNIVMFFVFAFSRWPVLDRGRGFGPHGYVPPPSSPGGYQPPGWQPSGYQPPGWGPTGQQPSGWAPPPPPAPPAPLQ
jgi:hypothetical protein